MSTMTTYSKRAPSYNAISSVVSSDLSCDLGAQFSPRSGYGILTLCTLLFGCSKWDGFKVLWHNDLGLRRCGVDPLHEGLQGVNRRLLRCGIWRREVVPMSGEHQRWE